MNLNLTQTLYKCYSQEITHIIVHNLLFQLSKLYDFIINVSSFCLSSAMLNNLIKKMFKLPFAHQKKQKILNYEIKMIQQCNDSLFNSANCSHQRYLQWNLYQNLKNIIHNQPYQIRWMGNDRNSYIYTYFYIAITACSKHPSAMVQLKSVLYGLAQKYLSQYEQKLLIQFLCLIEYSQEKYLFFRKYTKIESILVKLLQQIQHRSFGNQIKSPRTSLEDQNNFSKLTTCITSPCKSLQKEQDWKMRQFQSIQKPSNSIKKINDKIGKKRYIKMFEAYSKHFQFIKIDYPFENIIKFTIELQRIKKNSPYYVCVEKECFFVVQISTDELSSNTSQKSCSFIEEEKHYIHRLIDHQQKMSKIKKQSGDIDSKKSSNHYQFTPKFISNKKKPSILEQDLFNDSNVNKNVNIQILDVQQFSEKQSSLTQSKNAVLHYKNKIQNLGNINNTIKSIDLDKQFDNQYTKTNYRFGNYSKKVQTQQTLPSPSYLLQKHIYSNNLYSKVDQSIFTKKNIQNTAKKHYSFRNKEKSIQLQVKNHNENTKRVNPQNLYKTIRSNNKSTNETLLSANNLKRMNRQAQLIVKKPFPQPRQFHSHSPRNKMIQLRPTSNQNPFASPLKPRIPLKAKDNTIKFTYL